MAGRRAITPRENRIACIFHLAMVVFYTLVLYYDIILMNADSTKRIIDPKGEIPAYGGRFKFLTHINLWVQLFYFSVQFATDVLPKSHFKQTATKFVDACFNTTVAFPFAGFVVLAFWGIYAFDRELIYPVVYDKVVPWWFNHCWHTMPGLIVLIEMLLVFHQFPESSFAAFIVFFYNALYVAWIYWIYGETKYWVYEFLAASSPLRGHPLIFALCMILTFVIFIACNCISSRRWGSSAD